MSKTEVLDNKCPHCGGKTDYNPKTGIWKCLYCESEMTLEEMQSYNNASNIKNNTSVNNKDIDTYDNYMSYNCKNCGAEIITDEQTTATFCVYCGNTAILKNKLSGEFKPSKIIPFKKTMKDAEKAFTSLSKGRPLIPKSFTSIKNIEKIRGIYIPFWFHTFKIAGDVNYTGINVSTWAIGNTHYTKTDTYAVDRTGSLSFKSVPVDGSTRFDNALMNSIQPFNYKDLIPYNHAYLSGFLAERYDVESNDTRVEVEKNILNDAKNVFLNSGNYQTRKIKNNTLKTTDYNIEYVLLPVYMVNVKYGTNMYTFAMNGQTGKFIGNIPIDKKKALFIGITLFISLLLLLLLISYIVYKVGV